MTIPLNHDIMVPDMNKYWIIFFNSEKQPYDVSGDMDGLSMMQYPYDTFEDAKDFADNITAQNICKYYQIVEVLTSSF